MCIHSTCRDVLVSFETYLEYLDLDCDGRGGWARKRSQNCTVATPRSGGSHDQPLNIPTEMFTWVVDGVALTFDQS